MQLRSPRRSRPGRQPVPPRLRFEVFERDRFTCQYCGQKAPRVVLHCDHIVPVSAGGENAWHNLITACEACNLGKSDFPLPKLKLMEINEALQFNPIPSVFYKACDILARRDAIHPQRLYPLVNGAVEAGARPDDILSLCERVECWTEFEAVITDFVADGVPLHMADDATLQ